MLTHADAFGGACLQFRQASSANLALRHACLRQRFFLLLNSPPYLLMSFLTSMNVSKAVMLFVMMLAMSSPFVLAFLGVNRLFHNSPICSPFLCISLCSSSLRAWMSSSVVYRHFCSFLVNHLLKSMPVMNLISGRVISGLRKAKMMMSNASSIAATMAKAQAVPVTGEIQYTIAKDR